MPPRYLRTPEAARFLGLSVRTLEKHRTYGTGPTYRSSAAASSIASTTCKPGPTRPSLDVRSARRIVLPAKRQPASTAAERPLPALRRPAMSARHHQSREREQLDLFRALPGDLAPRDAQDLMAYPFFSLAKSHRIAPIDFRLATSPIRVEAVPEHGMATIWDADVLIWAASQIVEARDAGLRTSRLMAATPYEILTFIGRGASRSATITA